MGNVWYGTRKRENAGVDVVFEFGLACSMSGLITVAQPDARRVYMPQYTAHVGHIWMNNSEQILLLETKTSEAPFWAPFSKLMTAIMKRCTDKDLT